MAALPVVKRLQILEEHLPGLGSSLKRVAIHAFLFDGSKEALHQGIIVTIGFAAHAHESAIAAQQSPISVTGKLAATIGMMRASLDGDVASERP